VTYPTLDVARSIATGYSERVAQAPLTVRRWTRAEYARLVDLGMFEDDPLELVGGHLIVAEPQSAYHASAIRAVDYALRAVLPPGWIVSVQLPVSLDDESEPEPDLTVVPGRPADYRLAHPTHPVLAIEVAESSLAFDREHKGSLYARAGIPEYWIVNLVDRVLEVYRDPDPEPAALCGWRYRSVGMLTPPAVVVPVGLPSIQLTVSDLLP
jgi:Uma2 family endonuclease